MSSGNPGLGIVLVSIIAGQGPTVLAVGDGGVCLDIFSLDCHFCFLHLFFSGVSLYRLKYCLQRPLNPKQPINLKMDKFGFIKQHCIEKMEMEWLQTEFLLTRYV